MNKVLFRIFQFIVLLSAITTSGHWALAQQHADVDKWRLKTYVAAVTDNPSWCAGDQYCLDHTRYYRSLLCVDSVCNGKDKSKKPIECAKEFADQYAKEVQDKISSALCSMIKSPGPATRQAYLSLVVDEKEDEAVEEGGYLMALKGSAVSCENYIKNFVGAYGPKWNYQWYRALSGCRILARERTLEQEEKDFKTWLGVVHGSGHCSDIINSEMRQACSASGATSPSFASPP